MKKVADLLCILISFSIRADFHEKALRYARCGYELLPDDPRFIELYGYALILSEDFEKAEEVLSKAEAQTHNIAFLKTRTAIMLDLPQNEQKARINSYLAC